MRRLDRDLRRSGRHFATRQHRFLRHKSVRRDGFAARVLSFENQEISDMGTPPVQSCPACGARVTRDQSFCSRCGARLITLALVPTVTVPPRQFSRSPYRIDEGFPAGTVLAQRYRIVTLLGRGGMGEVYRADDLLLGQPVALKFLPPAATASESAVSRFRNEVRTARQVSHPNVCRVYDIGEAEGLTYLTMEYIDGEDLASLLRRIGKLPPRCRPGIPRRSCKGIWKTGSESQ